MDDDICLDHNREITHICQHLKCLKFRPLCDICYPEHITNNHPVGDTEQFIVTKQNCVQQTNQVLNNLRDELERTQDKAATELTGGTSQNIDEIIMEVESIKHQINRLFERYIQSLKEKFEQKIKIKIHKVYDEIKTNIETVKDFQKCSHMIKIMKLINQNDLKQQKNNFKFQISYQIQYQMSHLENLISQRANQRFEGKIDDDVALHFIGVIQKELEKLVVFENHKSYITGKMTQSQMIPRGSKQQQNDKKKFQSFSTVQMDGPSQYNVVDHSMFKHWLFHFEANSKTLSYIDLSKQKTSAFKQMELKIDFLLNKGGRAIYADDGKIYYICGYDEKEFQEQNEDHFKTIYQFVYEESTLKPVARMITLRNYFSVCASPDLDIYIIGGQNHKEGCLTKCEKISLKTNSITIINHLPEPSSLHSCAILNNRYIFKIGGCSITMDHGIHLCSDLVYVYNIEKDEWAVVSFPRNLPLPKHTLLSCALQMTEKSIYIFGGLAEQGNLTTQAYLLLIDEEEEIDNSDNLTLSLGFSFKLNYYPLKYPGLYLTQPLLVNQTTIYVVLSPDDSGVKRVVQMFDKKWKEF